MDVRDIAEATAIALTTAGHEGKTYNLNGPDIVSGLGAAAIWSEVLGKQIKYAGHDTVSYTHLDVYKRQPS